MSRHIGIIIIILTIGILSGCRNDFSFAPSTGNLSFSRDTVYLDTVFTNIGSSTYTLKVYNKSKTDIAIPIIQLKNGTQSQYRLSVDGRTGNSFENVELLAKDSLFIFIETTVAIEEYAQNATEFLYTDAIQFDSGDYLQEVALVTLIKDAIFLYPQKYEDGTIESILLGLDQDGEEIRIEGVTLEDEELHFTNERPYVIYGYAAVSEGKTLVMDPGTRVHFHNSSGLLIGHQGRLEVNGALSTLSDEMENEVLFEGDRLEPGYTDIPGQWGTIWLSAGSTAQLTNLTIKNATVGLLAESNTNSTTTDFYLSRVQIHNSGTIGLYGLSARLEAVNSIFGNAGQISFYGHLGGSYQFTHCTFANYWNKSFRNLPAVLLDNYQTAEDQNTISVPLEKADFRNCIIDGTNPIEMLLEKNSSAAFNFKLDHCLLAFNDISGFYSSNPLYDFSNSSLYNQLIRNLDTDFNVPEKHDFSLRETSMARGIGSSEIALETPTDIKGYPRLPTVDAGAYQFNPFAN